MPTATSTKTMTPPATRTKIREPTKVRKWHWKSGFRIPVKMDPAVVGRRLEKLIESCGENRESATPKIVKEGLRRDCPWHAMFKITPEQALNEARQIRARYLLQATVYDVIETSTDEIIESDVPVHYSIIIAGNPGRADLTPIQILLDDDIKGSTRRQLFKELMNFKNRAERFVSLEKIIHWLSTEAF